MHGPAFHGDALNNAQFSLIVRCPPDRGVEWFGPMLEAMVEFGIDTPHRQAAFLAQVGHESMNLTRLEEGLNYTAQRLMIVWPKRFPTIEATRYYEHSPERLANFVYANRNGNGSYESGDGYRFRGRGPIQITGRGNYRAFAQAVGRAGIEMAPERLLLPVPGSQSAAWFFSAHGCNDMPDIDAISRRINGGDAGLEDRRTRYVYGLQLLTETTSEHSE